MFNRSVRLIQESPSNREYNTAKIKLSAPIFLNLGFKHEKYVENKRNIGSKVKIFATKYSIFGGEYRQSYAGYGPAFNLPTHPLSTEWMNDTNI